MNAITRRLAISTRPALVHLSASGLIALLAMLLIFRVWYPAPLSDMQGVDSLVLIMIGVDVVIGPLITLIVYNPAKKSLPFDLGVVAMMQTIALLFGLQAIYGGRPAYVVFNVDRFDVIAVPDLNQSSLTRAKPEFKLSFWQPATVAARLPDDPQERSEILFSAVNGGADLPQLPEYFVPWQEECPAMLQRLRPLDELRKLNEMDKSDWSSFVATFQNRPESELGYLPAKGNARNGAMIVDSRSCELLGLHLLTPSFEPLKKRTPASEPASVPAQDSSR